MCSSPLARLAVHDNNVHILWYIIFFLVKNPVLVFLFAFHSSVLTKISDLSYNIKNMSQVIFDAEGV